MKGHNRTDSRILEKAKKIAKQAYIVLLKCDEDLTEGYTDTSDIPDPTIENFPEYTDDIIEVNRILNQIKEKANKRKSKISMSNREKIDINEFANKIAKEKRNHIKMKNNDICKDICK